VSSLASLNRFSKNVRVHAVIISELKFRDVQRHIFGADLVKAANNTAFEDAPKALNRVGVIRPDNILRGAMFDRVVRMIGEARIYCPLSGWLIVQLNH
jgi:hypothetical protein